MREFPGWISYGQIRLLLQAYPALHPDALALPELGLPPLMYAIAVRQEDLVVLLLRRGADPNRRWCVPKSDPACSTRNGMTPLMYAAQRGTGKIESLLIEAGANPSLRDWRGRTAADYRRKP
jgi:ankyrin repeat protein